MIIFLLQKMQFDQLFKKRNVFTGFSIIIQDIARHIFGPVTRID